MLPHNKTQTSFVDGVPVKISEQYKPPRRVILPVSCQNCTPGEALYQEVSCLKIKCYSNF